MRGTVGRVKRVLQRLWKRVKLWQKLVGLAVLPLVAINFSVATLGRSAVFPLSPFFLREKVDALGKYVAHLPACVLQGHPDQEALIRSAEKRNRLPRGLLRAVIDAVQRVSDDESFAMVKRLVREEGLFVGGSSGTNLAAALRVAARSDLSGPVVTVMCDGWDRYRAKPWMQGWAER